jgi:hypothetical protein
MRWSCRVTTVGTLCVGEHFYMLPKGIVTDMGFGGSGSI